MAYNLHVYQCDQKNVMEAVIEFAGSRSMNLSGSERSQVRWEIALRWEDRNWISVDLDDLRSTIMLSEHISGFLHKPVLAFDVIVPHSWGFWLCLDGSISGRFRWDFPEEMQRLDAATVHEKELEKVKHLGLIVTPELTKKIKGKQAFKEKSLRGSDPHIELSYRKKLSGSLIPAPADMPEDLPKILTSALDNFSAARFRKILSSSHLSVEGMVAEFTNYLEISDVFSDLADLKQKLVSGKLQCGKLYQFC